MSWVLILLSQQGGFGLKRSHVCCKFGSEPPGSGIQQVHWRKLLFPFKPPIRQICLPAWTFIAGHNSTAEMMLEGLLHWTDCSTSHPNKPLSASTGIISDHFLGVINDKPVAICPLLHVLKTSVNEETALPLRRVGDISEFPAKIDPSVNFRIHPEHMGPCDTYMTWKPNCFPHSFSKESDLSPDAWAIAQETKCKPCAEGT